MHKNQSGRVLKYLLLAAALQVVFSEYSEIDTKFELEKLNKKLEDLQVKLKNYKSEYTQDLLGFEIRGNTSLSLPRGCNEVLNLQGSGEFHIYLPDSGLKPFSVYCLEDKQDTQPWTVIQRRVNGDTQFYRGWEEYKLGFGDLSGNFWIGLDKLHALTSDPNNPQELWIQLKDNVTVDARYSLFRIGNEYEQYQLNALGVFTGSAGDALRANQGMKFTTYDFDNDNNAKSNCAQTQHGAWWYSNCSRSNLNGLYGDQAGDGVYWYDLHKNWLSMNYAQMAIRPVQLN